MQPSHPLAEALRVAAPPRPISSVVGALPPPKGPTPKAELHSVKVRTPLALAKRCSALLPGLCKAHVSLLVSATLLLAEVLAEAFVVVGVK